MTCVEYMLEASKNIWRSYNEHPFVKGIETGTLDKEKFRYYIIQDFFYLEDYVKSFAVGIAKAKSVETTNIFTKYVTLLTGSEMNIHKGYMGEFGVNEEELGNTQREIDNLSYTSYMLRIAYEESEIEILAAVLSCAYSYECIAKNMIKNNSDCINDDFYGKWIKGYASDEYSRGNVVLINTLNKLTENYNEQQIKHLTDIFIICSKYEYLFWDFSWEMGKICSRV